VDRDERGDGQVRNSNVEAKQDVLCLSVKIG
jgi:hypothetical protein